MSASSTARRLAAAAAAWALAFAGASAYWAAGGRIGSETVAKDLADRAAAREPGFVALLWAAAALKASLALLALALTRRPGRLVRSAGWATGALLTFYGAAGLVEFGLIAVGALKTPADVGAHAVLWYVFLWEPIWIVGGLLFLATTRAARSELAA